MHQLALMTKADRVVFLIIWLSQTDMNVSKSDTRVCVVPYSSMQSPAGTVQDTAVMCAYVRSEFTVKFHVF